MKVTVIFLLFLISFQANSQSTCYGTTSKGRLESGVELPPKGKNFVAYSEVARTLGRTYVHSIVRKIIVDAYQSLEKEQPNKVYKYAETGFRQGGQFKPHKTHRNGLSVDFITPVIDEDGNSVHLPTSPVNRFGYDIEFNENDRFEGLVIDYEALGAHIVELHKSSTKFEVDIWRVIFDPKLQPKLFNTRYASYLKKHVQFSTKRSWVRHDEHYHVDFKVPCKKFHARSSM
ncbi:MAG: penicillin-insensitive murein endopeptidase [Kangiellaceae bacterium]|nr:penicillin-insensitive murein endopeptidase [Kangiellaceae bacterium]MCW9016883.1 penicillin-insensitive murein endopeptidase [Kangiellaceae bacterium]